MLQILMICFDAKSVILKKDILKSILYLRCVSFDITVFVFYITFMRCFQMQHHTLSLSRSCPFWLSFSDL